MCDVHVPCLFATPLRKSWGARLARVSSSLMYVHNITLQLLNDGLNDHSELVQEACVNGLLRSWSLESMDGDFITLLSRLDVESSQQVLAIVTYVHFAYGGAWREALAEVLCGVNIFPCPAMGL